jgi:hypothetical protein
MSAEVERYLEAIRATVEAVREVNRLNAAVQAAPPDEEGPLLQELLAAHGRFTALKGPLRAAQQETRAAYQAGRLHATEEQVRRMLRLEGELDQLQAAIRDSIDSPVPGDDG